LPLSIYSSLVLISLKLPPLEDVLEFQPSLAQSTQFLSIYTSLVQPEEYFYHTFRKKVNPHLNTFFKMSISTYPLLWPFGVVEFLCRGLYLIKTLIIAIYPANSMILDSLSGTSKLFTNFRCPSSRALVYLAVVEMSACPRVA